MSHHLHIFEAFKHASKEDNIQPLGWTWGLNLNLSWKSLLQQQKIKKKKQIYKENTFFKILVAQTLEK